MNAIELLPIGEVPASQLNELAGALAAVFGVRCSTSPERIDPAFALHAERRQYHSSEILARMRAAGNSSTRLGVTCVDLYIPILTFVFGEAEVGGSSAIVSLHRLRQEFYGLAPDLELERTRLLKEAVHELGHTLEMTHCDDYRCVMAPSHAVEWIDVKSHAFCDECSSQVRSALKAGYQQAGRAR